MAARVREVVRAGALIGALLVAGWVLVAVPHPYHTFAHTGHDHVEYEVRPASDVDAEAAVLRGHVEEMRARDVPQPSLRWEPDGTERRLLAEASEDGTATAGSDAERAAVASLGDRDFVYHDLRWYRTTSADGTTLRVERVAFGEVASAAAVPVDELGRTERRAVQRLLDADDGVLLSSSAVPEHLLVETPDGPVAVGCPHEGGCGYAAARGRATTLAVLGLAALAICLLVVGELWLARGRPDERVPRRERH